MYLILLRVGLFLKSCFRGWFDVLSHTVADGYISLGNSFSFNLMHSSWLGNDWHDQQWQRSSKIAFTRRSMLIIMIQNAKEGLG